MTELTFAEALARLHEIALYLGKPKVTSKQRAQFARELLNIEKRMRRRKPLKVARAKARPMTEARREQIMVLRELHPDLPNREIGRLAGVDGGRVSEVMRGYR